MDYILTEEQIGKNHELAELLPVSILVLMDYILTEELEKNSYAVQLNTYVSILVLMDYILTGLQVQS